MAAYQGISGRYGDRRQYGDSGYEKAAVEFCKGYTGLTEEQLDEHEDITIVVLMLIADMYDNRQLQVDKNVMNKTAETILGMYCINFL